jgi:hypothetical protein
VFTLCNLRKLYFNSSSTLHNLHKLWVNVLCISTSIRIVKYGQAASVLKTSDTCASCFCIEDVRHLQVPLVAQQQVIQVSCQVLPHADYANVCLLVYNVSLYVSEGSLDQ